MRTAIAAHSAARPVRRATGAAADMRSTFLANARTRLLAATERRLPALTRLRRAEPLPIRLDRRRIYVLPTRFGLLFAALLFVMLLGALNYGNNPALLLTCLLGGAAGASVFSGFRVLSGLVLRQVRAAEAHAGKPLPLHLCFASAGRARPALHARCADTAVTFALAAAGDGGEAVLTLPDATRGWFRPGRVRVSTDYPLGLFQLWSWLHPDVELLVYPALESPAPPLPAGSGQHGEQARRGASEERAGLRDYRPGDAAQLIAWKASARHDTLLARDVEHHAGSALVLDYAALSGLDGEARIRRLAAWVVAAEVAQRSYTLRLPDEVVGPGLGAAHRRDCLRTLALLPVPAA